MLYSTEWCTTKCPSSPRFPRRRARCSEVALPHAYLDLLAVTDGLDWNGAVLYASETRLRNDELDIQGLLEASIQLRLAYTPDKDFVYFAESGMDFYRHNLQTGKFEISARIGGTVFAAFETAEELFVQILNHMLGNYGEEEEADEEQKA
ncbi:MAG TPA: YrhA family protein [Hymenobacter sp.]